MKAQIDALVEQMGVNDPRMDQHRELKIVLVAIYKVLEEIREIMVRETALPEAEPETPAKKDRKK